MADVIYIKYNRTRKEEFQIKTEILREDGALWVEKSALTEAGILTSAPFRINMKP